MFMAEWPITRAPWRQVCLALLGLVIVGLVGVGAHWVYKLAQQAAAEKDAALRELGCEVVTIETLHSLNQGEEPGSIWVCDGTPLGGNLAAVIANERLAGRDDTWRRLRNKNDAARRIDTR